jgi:uncharacterized membrane protein YoaK (UPF0700 family)
MKESSCTEQEDSQGLALSSLALFGLTAGIGVVAGAALRRRYRLAAMTGLAIAIVIGVFLAAYLSGSPGPEHSSCDDCPNLLGRYWDPKTTTVLAFVGVSGFIAGSGVGALARPLIRGLQLLFRQHSR